MVIRHTKTKDRLTVIELLVVIAIIANVMAILLPAFAGVPEHARQRQCLNNLKKWGSAHGRYLTDYDNTFVMSQTSSSSWPTTLDPYVRDRRIYWCPSRTPIPDSIAKSESASAYIQARYIHYGMAIVYEGLSFDVTGIGRMQYYHPPVRTSQVAFPAECILLAECYDKVDDVQQSLPRVWSSFPVDNAYGFYLAYPYTDALTSGPNVSEVHIDGANVLFADTHAGWLTHTQLEDLHYWRISGATEPVYEP